MAKTNPEQMPPEALPSPSAASSTSLVPVLSPSQPAGVGPSANGSTLGSADSPPLERATSHRHASSSPRCAFAWLNGLPAIAKGEGLYSTPLTLLVSRSTLKHIVGKGGRMLARLEDYTGSLISISDSPLGTGSGTVKIWGGQCEFARVLILAISFGFYSVLDTVSRNGITHLPVGD